MRDDTRRSLLAAAVAGLAALTTACASSAVSGGVSQPVTASQPPSAAASWSGQSTPSAPALVPATTSHELLDRITKAAEANGTVSTRFSSTSPVGRVTGGGPARFGAAPAADLTMTIVAPGAVVQARGLYVDSTFYLQFGATAHLPSGKSWLAASQPDMQGDNAAALRPLVSAMNEMGGVRSEFEGLAAATAFTAAGQETLDSVPTVKYDVTVDVARAFASASDETTRLRYSLIRNSGAKTLAYSFWVDGNDLPRQMVSTATAGAGTETTTITYSAWGEPVDIKAPAPDRVAHLAELT